MKKMFLSVAMLVAMVGASQANNDVRRTEIDEKIETIEDVIQANDSTPYIISFYNVDRIKVVNQKNVLIRVYDETWKLIKETNKDVDFNVTPGNYYIACEQKIKSRLISRD